MSKSNKPKLVSVEFTFLTQDESKGYVVIYIPKQFDNPKFTYRVEVWANGGIVGTFRSGQHPNKTNAISFINQTEEQL
jgi:hypothetical protein